MEQIVNEINQRLKRIESYLESVNHTKVEQEFLNAHDAAKYLNLSVGSLYNKTSQNEVPFYKKGRLILFKKEELKKWLEEGKVQTKAEIKEEVRNLVGHHKRAV